MPIEVQDTVELMGVLRNYPPEQLFFLDRYFSGRSYFSNSEWIEFDEIDAPRRRLAPFVVPNVQGQPMRLEGYETTRIKPAYLKPKNSLDSSHVLRRQAGESLGGSMTPGQRDLAVINDVLLMQADSIRRRWNWMGCQVLRTGAVVIEGENYPARTVDFERNASHTVTLSGTAVWGGADANVWGNLLDWNRLVYESGSPGRDLILGRNASTLFFADEKVQAAMETRRGSVTTLESYNVQGSPVTYHGTLQGGLNVFTYGDAYENNMGVMQDYLDPDEILLVGDIGGVRAFGAIMDRKAGYQPVAMFPKMWENEDPSALYLMTQSAPLMVPTNVNSALRAVVV
jgi:hypothetical protein